jgi:hypothetical protein
VWFGKKLWPQKILYLHYYWVWYPEVTFHYQSCIVLFSVFFLHFSCVVHFSTIHQFIMHNWYFMLHVFIHFSAKCSCHVGPLQLLPFIMVSLFICHLILHTVHRINGFFAFKWMAPLIVYTYSYFTWTLYRNIINNWVKYA